MMLKIAISFLMLVLVGCTQTDLTEQKVKLEIEAGAVTNWRNPRLAPLERALSRCDDPEHAMRYSSDCAARQNELDVFVEAYVDCAGRFLSMCLAARKVIESGPQEFVTRVKAQAANVERMDFDWYQAPSNPLLKQFFSPADRWQLLEAAFRRNLIGFGILLILGVVVWQIRTHHRREVREHEIRLADLERLNEELRRSRQIYVSVAEKNKLLAYQVELEITKKSLAYEEYLSRCEDEKRRAAEREKLSRLREQVRKYLGISD